MKRVTVRGAVAPLLMLIASFAVGCNSGPRNAPVNADKARETLRTALESWKKGDAANSLEKSSPPIYIIDPEWTAGAKLIAYEILGDGEEMDAHLFCKVRITVRNGSREGMQDVTYVVATAPNLTVSRKLF